MKWGGQVVLLSYLSVCIVTQTDIPAIMKKVPKEIGTALTPKLDANTPFKTRLVPVPVICGRGIHDIHSYIYIQVPWRKGVYTYQLKWTFPQAMLHNK